MSAVTLHRSAPPSSPSSPATPATGTRWIPEAASRPGTRLLFALYILLLALDWAGVQNEIPMLKTARITTLLAYGLAIAVLTRGALEVFAERQAKILVGIVAFTALSVLWAYVQSYAFSSIRPLVDYLAFMVVTYYVLDRRARLDAIAVFFVFLVIYLVGRNFDRLDAQRVGSFAAPYFLGDGNDFAWGMNVMAPIILTLVFGQRAMRTRIFGLLGFTVCVVGIIGTQSRGGNLGFAAAMLYAWWFVAKRKTVGAVAVMVTAAAIVVVAPAGYFTRMGSVVEYEDNSAQARLQAWGAAIRMARDHPLGVGAGNFGSAYGRFYNPSTVDQEGQARVEWGAGRWINAHSIYFKVLGEYGFPGLALLLWLIVSVIRDNFATRREIRASPHGAPVGEHWPDLVNMSVVAFAVCGAFLGGVAYPHIFFLIGVTLATKRLVTLARRPAAVVASAPVPSARIAPHVGAGVPPGAARARPVRRTP